MYSRSSDSCRLNLLLTAWRKEQYPLFFLGVKYLHDLRTARVLLQNRIRMPHVYQSVMLIALLREDGTLHCNASRHLMWRERAWGGAT
jgi:hypothetical protein